MINKLIIPVALMILTIIVITVFQVYWLRKNFSEEKSAFDLHTNILFRETIFKLQASKLRLDFDVKISAGQMQGVVRMVNILRDKKNDTSSIRPGATMVIMNQGQATGTRMVHTDTNVRYMTRNAAPGSDVINLLSSVDSLQDPITLKEVDSAFGKILKKEKIDLPYTLSVITPPMRQKKVGNLPDIDEMIDQNKVTIGLVKPVTYQLEFGNKNLFLLKKLSQPILISCLLVGVTIFSFLFLYRNILKQRRLTEIKNDFISNISHELKTPVATVIVAIEALRSFNALGDPQRTKEYLDISASELQRLSLLVDRVLKLSMFEKKALELKKEIFDLKSLVAEVIITLRPMLEKQHAVINYTTKGEHFLIEGDKLHLNSVIYNLLDNALKYTVEIPVITVHLSALPFDILELTVKDNGIGIPTEYRSKIFTKFFRVPTGDKHTVKGYGLGLSYVSEVLSRHKGFITVESEPGAGSTFIVKVPVKEKDVIQFDEYRRIIKKKFRLG